MKSSIGQGGLHLNRESDVKVASYLKCSRKNKRKKKKKRAESKSPEYSPRMSSAMQAEHEKDFLNFSPAALGIRF